MSLKASLLFSNSQFMSSIVAAAARMNGQKSDLNIQRPLLLLREEEFPHLQNSFFNEYFPKSRKTLS